MDLWVEPLNESNIHEIMSEAKSLGFECVALSYLDDAIFREAERVGKEVGVKVYRKIVLEPESRSDLLRDLKKHRGRCEVISVICGSLDVALTASRDGRVDTVIIPPDKRFRIDKGVASLIRNPVEIPFRWFLNRETRRDFIKVLLEIVDYLASRTDIVVSSRASSRFELRGPREMATLLQAVGIDENRSLSAVSNVPIQIIERNLTKLSPNYLYRGVMKIEQEEEEVHHT